MATATATRMKIKPLGDKVLVKRTEPETKTASGIYLPESAKEKPQEAQVIAVGQGRLLENGERLPFQVKKGDKVLLNKWGGSDVKIDDEEYLIVTEDDILGVIG
jgi:chaperonin GroES